MKDLVDFLFDAGSIVVILGLVVFLFGWLPRGIATIYVASKNSSRKNDEEPVISKVFLVGWWLVILGFVMIIVGGILIGKYS